MTKSRKRFEVPQEIRIDGITVLRGNGTLGVIYNNLVGLNIKDQREYAQYLEFMRDHLCLEALGSSNHISFLSNLTEVACGRIGDPQAVRVTEEVELEALRAQFLGLQREAELLDRSLARGQEHEKDAQRMEQIERLMESSPLCLCEEEGLILKSDRDVQAA